MSAQKGFSLLETSIAMGVMVVGLTGLAALLMQTLAGTQMTSQQHIASWLAESLASQAGLSRDPVPALLSPGPAPNCIGRPDCSPDEFLRSNYLRWQTQVATALPQGQGVVCRDQSMADGGRGEPECDHHGQPVIKVFWRMAANGGDDARHIRALRP